MMINVGFDGVALLLFGLGLIVFFILFLKYSQNKHQSDSDMIKRLCVLVEQENSERIQENERQQIRMREVERRLFEGLQQSHHTTTEHLHTLTGNLTKEQSATRLEQAKAMRDFAEQSARHLSELRQSVTDRLHTVVESQMQTSFQRVLEQFSEVQKAMGEMSSFTAQIGDLKRLFSNVKTRGGWGEAQLRSILDDILPTGTYETNIRLVEGSQENVEFAVYMPAQGTSRPLLPIDSKFPTEAYEKLLTAIEQGDRNAEQAARKVLESVLKQEAKKIAKKYIVPPKTVDFAILYLPTDGLYTEIARIPGLIDEVGRLHHILIMSPALMPSLLRTIHLGYTTLALGEKTEVISRILGKTRQEMIKMDAAFEKLSRHTNCMVSSLTELRRRSQRLMQQLQEVGNIDMEKESEDNIQLVNISSEQQ